MRVLVCEQDPLIGTAAVEALEAAGFDVVGPVDTLDAARGHALHEPLHGAICSLNLIGGSTGEIIDILLDRELPVIVTTAVSASGWPVRVAELTVFEKPYDVVELVMAAETLFRPPGR